MTQENNHFDKEDSVYIEVVRTTEEKDVEFAVHRGFKEGAIIEFDQTLANIVQREIIRQCEMMDGAFKKLKEQSLLPKKASVEFGLQFNAEGTIYIAKIGEQSTFKITYEWEFDEQVPH